MLYSPETDVYHIGLPILLKQQPQLDVYIQLCAWCKNSNRYLHVNAFLHALASDPDLAQVPLEKRASIMQMLYIATGCDYISYFKGIGKVFFLNVFYQHATFITSGSDPIGSLVDISPETAQLGLLAFVRLVGCGYYKKHLTGFKFSTPEELFHSISAISPEEQHKKWLKTIQSTVWERTFDESHYVPSYEAFSLHWKRCIWVMSYWSEATENQIEIPG